MYIYIYPSEVSYIWVSFTTSCDSHDPMGFPAMTILCHDNPMWSTNTKHKGVFTSHDWEW